MTEVSKRHPIQTLNSDAVGRDSTCLYLFLRVSLLSPLLSWTLPSEYQLDEATKVVKGLEVIRETRGGMAEEVGGRGKEGKEP